MRHAIRAAAFVAAATLSLAAHAQQQGVTSGPAAGTPATLGTGGEGATRHQQDSLKNKGGPAVRNEKQGQAGGTNASVKPGAPEQESGTISRKPQ